MPRKRRIAKARVNSPMISTAYWKFLNGADIHELGESALWDRLILEVGQNDLTIDAFRDALFNGVLDGSLSVGEVKHRLGDGERLIAALQPQPQ